MSRAIEVPPAHVKLVDVACVDTPPAPLTVALELDEHGPNAFSAAVAEAAALIVPKLDEEKS
jgi:hypothetical protein